MHILEARIPPLLLAVFFIVMMWLVDSATMSHDLLNGYRLFYQFAFPIACILLLFGIAICLMGVMGFKKAQTTVDPTKPEKTSSLVTNGIYQFSRNPMYVGFLCLILAWGMYLDNLCALAFALLFIPYMNRFQIQVEEQILLEIFGEEYKDYQSKVRRWL